MDDIEAAAAGAAAAEPAHKILCEQWHQLSRSEQNFAIGWIASSDKTSTALALAMQQAREWTKELAGKELAGA